MTPIFDSPYVGLDDKQAEALHELDCIQRPTAEDLERLVPDLPAGDTHELAEGLLHGLAFVRPQGWESRLAASASYKEGWWEGWTRTVGQAWARA